MRKSRIKKKKQQKNCAKKAYKKPHLRVKGRLPVGPAALRAALNFFQKLDELGKLTFVILPLYERLLAEDEKVGLHMVEKGS